MLLASLMVVLVATVVTNRALSLKMGEGLEDQAQGARDAAASGMEAVIAELKRPVNSSLLGDPAGLDWNTMQICPQSSSITSTNWCVLSGKGLSSKKDASLRFRMYAAVWRNSDRNNQISKQFPTPGGPEITSPPLATAPPIVDTPRYLQVTIEGQSFLPDNIVMAQSRITQEFKLEHCPDDPPGSTWCIQGTRFRSFYGNI